MLRIEQQTHGRMGADSVLRIYHLAEGREEAGGGNNREIEISEQLRSANAMVEFIACLGNPACGCGYTGMLKIPIEVNCVRIGVT